MSNQKITKEEVKKIASKAKLRLSDKEVEKYLKELEDILEFVNKIREVDTEAVEPTYQVNMTSNIGRDDQIEEAEDKVKDKIIENFPERSGRLLKIPPVL